MVVRIQLWLSRMALERSARVFKKDQGPTSRALELTLARVAWLLLSGFILHRIDQRGDIFPQVGALPFLIAAMEGIPAISMSAKGNS